MSISAASISSSALGFLGEAAILTLLDETARARLCNQHFEVIRDTLLTSHPWNFAKKRVNLVAVDTPSPVFDYSFTFALPSDYLRMVKVSPTWAEYEIQGSDLVADTGEIGISYVYRMTDYGAYNPMFVLAFEYKLAAAIAPVLKGDFKIVQAYEGMWQYWDKQAKIMDAQDERPKEIPADDLIDVRKVN